MGELLNFARVCRDSEGLPISTQILGGSKLRAMISAIAPLPQKTDPEISILQGLCTPWKINMQPKHGGLEDGLF